MKKSINKIQYIALIVLGFVIIGATSALSGDIAYGRLRDAAYYVDLTLTYLAIILVISGIMIKAVMDYKAESEEYQQGEADIKRFADHTYRPLAFSKFCAKVNRVRKINQFKFNIQREIVLMDYPSWWRRLLKLMGMNWGKKTSEGAKLWERTFTESMTDDEKAALLLLKDQDPYCQKKRELLSKLDPEWIQDNIDNIEIKYDRINGSIILSGYYNKAENETPNDFIVKYKSAKVAKDRGPLLMIGFGIAAFAGALAAQFTFDGSWALTTLTKSLILLYQMLLTVRYAADYNERVTLHDIRFRRGNVKEYENWVKAEASEKELRQREELELKKIKAIAAEKAKEVETKEVEVKEVQEDGNENPRTELNLAKS